MNKLEYKMSYEDRKNYVYNEALEELKGDNDIFVIACEELDNWDGFLGDDRVYDMSELDDLLYGKSPLEIIEMTEGNNFSTSDDYFQFTMYGLESTDDKYDVYSSNYGAEEVLDELIDKYNHVSLYGNGRFNELIEVLHDEDFGIDEDWEYDEDMEDIPEETDDEFKERIDNL